MPLTSPIATPIGTFSIIVEANKRKRITLWLIEDHEGLHVRTKARGRFSQPSENGVIQAAYLSTSHGKPLYAIGDYKPLSMEEHVLNATNPLPPDGEDGGSK